MGKFKEFLEEAAFKSSKKDYMMYANGEKRAYRIGISEDNIIIFAAKGFSDNYSEIAKIKYDLTKLSSTIKELRKQDEYSDFPTFGKAQETQADLIHFQFAKERASEKETYNYWLK